MRFLRKIIIGHNIKSGLYITSNIHYFWADFLISEGFVIWDGSLFWGGVYLQLLICLTLFSRLQYPVSVRSVLF